MEDNDTKKFAIALPGEWALKKILGPTLDTLGGDINNIYQLGRDKIIQAAKRKISNIEDGASANLRVSRDVFWSGAFTDESICAEYFGGILAASRSQDGKDDTGIYYVDLIKSLSSDQLRLHYVVYKSLNKLMSQDQSKKDLNVGQSTKLSAIHIYFATKELMDIGLKIDTDLEALYRKGLLHEYKIDEYSLEDQMVFIYTMAVPTVLGIQTFAIANNMFEAWREYNLKDFGGFEDIVLPKYFSFEVGELIKQVGIKIKGDQD